MNTQKPVIILLGPQGSGKGTQGKRLAEKLGIPYLETGQLLRDEVASGSEQGKYLSSIIDKGQLLSDNDINSFMKGKVEAAVQSGQGFALDGYPRRIGQAEFIDPVAKPTHVLLIEIPDEESVSRLLLRAEKEGRVDDTREKILYRLEQYHTDTEPLIGYYAGQGILHRIDGMPDIEAVWQAVEKIFNASS